MNTKPQQLSLEDQLCDAYMEGLEVGYYLWDSMKCDELSWERKFTTQEVTDRKIEAWKNSDTYKRIVDDHKAGE